VLKLLEDVSGKPRRAVPDAGGSYAAAVRQSEPLAYWRLADIGGDVAADAGRLRIAAHYEDEIARYLPGPTGSGFSEIGEPSQAAHLAGGRIWADVPRVGRTYSVEVWFWNGLPNDARAVTGYLFSHQAKAGEQRLEDQLGIGGTQAAKGRLFFFDGNRQDRVLEGRTLIDPRTWNHVVLVRDGKRVRAYLNGRTEPEIDGEVIEVTGRANYPWYFGGRLDKSANFEGKLAEVAIYDQALKPDEVANHYRAASVPAGK
jgi:concanavalin A-like lectin/glucanase superfamily protein